VEARLIALKLFLDELGLDHNITTVQDRKRFQKAVFLGQMAGADMGYRYGWYLMGPYSSALTRDYYELSEALSIDDEDVKNYSLNSDIRNLLEKIKPCFSVPADVKLPMEDWLELLSSILYLKKISELDDGLMQQKLKTEKPTLDAYVGNAKNSLQLAGLLQ